MKWHLPLVFSLAFLVVACGDESQPQDPDGSSDDPPLLGAPRRNGDVGQGYDSINRSIQAMYCIQPANGGSWPEVGYASSTVSMTLESDRTKIARSMGLDVEVSYGIVSAAASFYRETESDDFSVSYVFGGTMNFKDVQVGGNYEVNPHLLDVDVLEWHRLCGDSYVQSITRGASLYAAMKFHFGSRSEKQQFETSFKVAGGLSASAALQAAEKISQQRVGVTVTGVQVGGDVTQLTRALAGADAASCSLQSIDRCLQYLNTIETYASETFPSQFLDAAGRPLTGSALDMVTATTGYVSRPWSTLAIPQLPNLSDKPEARKILGLFSKQFAVQARIDAINAMPLLLRRGAETADLQRDVLDADGLVVAQNLAALHEAWDACHPTVGAACAGAIEAAEAGLVEVDPAHLVPWYDMRYDDGTPGNPLDLIDIDGDGSADLCYGYERVVRCLKGVGLGFEETPTKWIDHGEGNLRDKPWAWIDLGGTELGLAFCSPFSLIQTTLHCIPVVDGSLAGTVLFLRGSDGSVEIRTSLDATGIDGKAVFQQAAQIINDRWNGIWEGAL